jgi:hypothetical protein
VEAHGNVFASCAFLHGLSAEDLTPAELNYRDDTFQLTVMGRAVKSVPMAHARDPGNEEPRP